MKNSFNVREKFTGGSVDWVDLSAAKDDLLEASCGSGHVS